MTQTNIEAQQGIQRGSVDHLAIQEAIFQALKLADKGGARMTVVRTRNHGICIFNDAKLAWEEHEIEAYIYCTDTGFIFNPAG